MSAKDVVVKDGFTITAKPLGEGIPKPDTFDYQKIQADNMICEKQPVLVQTLTIIAHSCSSPENSCKGGGPIVATAQKTMSDNRPVLRVGDTGTCTGMALVKKGNAIIEVKSSCMLEITDAGQTKVKGE